MELLFWPIEIGGFSFLMAFTILKTSRTKLPSNATTNPTTKARGPIPGGYRCTILCCWNLIRPSYPGPFFGTHMAPYIRLKTYQHYLSY